MKTLLISIAVLLLGGLTFTIQSSRLKNLKQENLTLNKRTQTHSLSPQSQATQFRSESTHSSRSAKASKEVVESFIKEWTDLMALALKTKNKTGLSPNIRERYLQLLRIPQNFSPENIQTVIDAIRIDPRFDNKEAIINEVLENAFIQVTPFSAFVYLLNQSHEQHQLESCFALCSVTDREQAFALYEQHKGNPALDSEIIRDSILLSLADHDPVRMLALATSKEFASDSAKVGISIPHRFEKTEHHLEFMAALQSAQASQPDIEKLKKIRGNYISQLSNQIERRSFEEAQRLIKGGFTPEEKMQVFSRVSKFNRIGASGASAEEWAKFFLEVELDDWNNWSNEQDNKSKHPFIVLVRDLGQNPNARTTETVDKILANVPTGELRNQTILEFAWALAGYGNDPETAVKYANELPEGKAKRRILRRIAKAKK